MVIERADDFVRVGLCARCTHVHIVENRRGSRFYRCRLADVDPAFPRYPPLPVLLCPGYARAVQSPVVDAE
jgi:hypothetical protein